MSHTILQSSASIARSWLERRGIQINDIAKLVYDLQQDYYGKLTPEECVNHVLRVLEKREVQNTVLTGIQLDMLAEKGKLEEPLQDMIARDEGLYGCDEILALSIVNVYGSIGLTNFGYIDKVKPGIIQRMNEKRNESVHTFLDDIVGAIAASASSRIAHARGVTERTGASGISDLADLRRPMPENE